MHTADEILVGASNEDAQINTERGDEIADTEIELKEQELQSAVSRLQRELKKKDRLVATQDEEIASMNNILRKIGDMVNNKSGDANHGGHDTQREIDNLRSVIDHYKTEIDSLKEQLKNSKPIETVDLTNEVEPSSATEDISNDEGPPSKRRRTKSNLANALEQSQQMVAVKEEAVQRAAAAEANAETARREKDAVEASLRDVQEDLEIQQETTEQVAVTLDTWQSRFDAVCGLAEAAGVDAAVLRSIREGNHN
jgi:chromosome segregation ATPase